MYCVCVISGCCWVHNFFFRMRTSLSFLILLICVIVEPKKPKLGKEKVWDVSPHRNEEMDTLRKLGVYWLPDSSRQQKWVGNPTAYPWHTARSPVQRWWSVRYITFYLFPHVILMFFTFFRLWCPQPCSSLQERTPAEHPEIQVWNPVNLSWRRYQGINSLFFFWIVPNTSYF